MPSIRLSYFNGPLKNYETDEAVLHTEDHSDSSDEEDVKAEQARFQEVLQGVKIAFRKTSAPIPQPHGQLETVAFEGPVMMDMQDAGIEAATEGDDGEEEDAVEAIFNVVGEEHDKACLHDREFIGADD